MAHERLETGVASLRQQHGADADTEIRDPRRALADVRERGGEAGATGDLDQDLRQIDPGQPCCHGVTQRQQRRWLLDFIEGAQDQLVLAVDALKAHRRITG